MSFFTLDWKFYHLVSPINTVSLQLILVPLTWKCMHAFSVASVVSNSLQPHGLYPARPLCPWDFSGKNAGVDCHALLQGIFWIQETNSSLLLLLLCRSILYLLSHQGSLDLKVQFNSAQFVSDSLWPHGMQHTRSPCPSPTPGTCSNACLLSQWCHPTISSSVIPFFFCLQFFLASGSFQMTQLFVSGAQSIEPSASTSVLPKTFRADFLQDGLVGSPCSPRDSQESSPTPQFKSINSSVPSFLSSPTLTSIHDY